MHKMLTICLTFLLIALATIASADERKYGSFLYDTRTPNTLFFFDAIENGDAFQLRKALRSHSITTIVLASPGGSVWEALSMAGQIYDRSLRVFVPKDAQCVSACSFMFFGAVKRYSEGKVGVHQFVSSDPMKTELRGKTQQESQFTVSEIIGFLNEFETPRFVFERMFEGPEVYFFNEAELRSLNSKDFNLSQEERNKIYDYILEKGSTKEEELVKSLKYTKTELVSLIQARLNEIGCDAGPVDGIWGRRTNAAAAAFAKQAETPKSEKYFLSTPFLNELNMAPENFCPKPKKVLGRFHGRWQLVARCTSISNLTGSATLKSTSAGRYAVSYSNSLGQTATGYAVENAGMISFHLVWSWGGKTTAQMTPDRNASVLTGTSTDGCNMVATRN